VAPYHDSNDINRGGPHGWDNAQADINGGKMDGFLEEAYRGISLPGRGPCDPDDRDCTPGRDARDVMGWHDYRKIPNYWNFPAECADSRSWLPISAPSLSSKHPWHSTDRICPSLLNVTVSTMFELVSNSLARTPRAAAPSRPVTDRSSFVIAGIGIKSIHPSPELPNHPLGEVQLPPICYALRFWWQLPP